MEKTKIIVKSIFRGYLITLILLFVYSILLAHTKLSESTIPSFVFAIGMFSVFITSSFTLIKTKKNGLKTGGIIGLGYVFILYLLSSIFENTFVLTKYSIMTIIFYILLGMVGGIIGVNLSRGN